VSEYAVYGTRGCLFHFGTKIVTCVFKFMLLPVYPVTIRYRL